MRTNFKMGDKVRVTRSVFLCELRNKVGIVISVRSNIACVTFDGYEWWININDLEIVEEKVKVENKFKVGDRVYCKPSGIYNEYGIVKEHNEYRSRVMFDDKGYGQKLLWRLNDSLKRVEDIEEINIYRKNNMVIATKTINGKKVKSGVARCNPEDEFDFDIGSKLALDRLLDKPKVVRHVKRHAKVGEYIRITSHENHEAIVGEIYKVTRLIVGHVFIDYAHQCISNDQYLVVENYKK